MIERNRDVFQNPTEMVYDCGNKLVALKKLGFDEQRFVLDMVSAFSPFLML